MGGGLGALQSLPSGLSLTSWAPGSPPRLPAALGEHGPRRQRQPRVESSLLSVLQLPYLNNALLHGVVVSKYI